MTGHSIHTRPGDRAQSTVEMAIAIPVIAILMAAVLQVGLLARDRVVLGRVTSAAARAAMVEPTDRVVSAELLEHRGSLRVESWSLTGSRSAGGLLTLEVTARPTPVPLVGLAVSGVRLTERLVVRVEG